MKTYAFVGASGSGKSYSAMLVCRKYGVEAIIDDGLLIYGNKVLAGSSAKKEPTRLASVRRALFSDSKHTEDVIEAIKKADISSILIIGTSEKMISSIVSKLKLPEVKTWISISDIASDEDIKTAMNIRKNEGKHVVPAPTFEIKKDFSGFYIHPLKIFKKFISGIEPYIADKSVVRPSFSYLGEYTISDAVLEEMSKYEAEKIDGISRVLDVEIKPTVGGGAIISVFIVVNMGTFIPDVCSNVKNAVFSAIEKYTSLNLEMVNVTVKGIV